jgi:hypothetical protein
VAGFSAVLFAGGGAALRAHRSVFHGSPGSYLDFYLLVDELKRLLVWPKEKKSLGSIA